ncbi:MAG: hypothetical protein KDI90_11070 [Alphaproteobacteria bacterium]|nr:hypothetical protein [Alphaproteobacteria bacterium]MCB9974733.1 hypothetical protein [Rhodospirillales bacterium]
MFNRIHRSMAKWRTSVALSLTVCVLSGCAGSGSYETADAELSLIKREPITRLAFVSVQETSLEVSVDEPIEDSYMENVAVDSSLELSAVETSSGYGSVDPAE